MANYHSEFTGPQADEAIQQVLDNHEEWSNKVDPERVELVEQAVVALQTAMNGKADLTTIFGAKRLNLNQVPLAFITYRNASATFPGRTGENNVTWLRYTDNLYRICYHNNGEDVVLGAPQNMLYYSGNGIYTWSGSQFQKIVDLTDYFEDGRLKMDALPENLPTGGLSDDIYTAIKDNVDTLWTKLNTLIGDLANLAFRGTKTSQLTNNDKTPWPENEGSDQTPTLTKPANNGGTILVGTASGGLITTSVEIKGIHLTQQLVISVSGTGFSVSSETISAADANAGTTITVTYNSTSLNSATGSLLISSSEVSRTANLLVLAGGGTTQTFIVTQNLTGCRSSYSGGTVTEGTTLTIVLTPNSGRTFTGGTISATMNNVAVAVTDGSNGTKVISFGAVTGDIVITAVAVEEQPAPSQSIELVQGKFINQYGEKTVPSGINAQYADVLCCLSVPIDVNFGTMISDATEWESARIEWTHGVLPMNCYLALPREGGQTTRTIIGSLSATMTELNSSNITGWANLLNSGTRAKQLTATFPCESDGNGGYKVVDGCSVVLYDGNGNSWPLISASDLQNATWVTE